MIGPGLKIEEMAGAKALMTFILSRVRRWSKDRGVETMAGPMNLSAKDKCGVLVGVCWWEG